MECQAGSEGGGTLLRLFIFHFYANGLKFLNRGGGRSISGERLQARVRDGNVFRTRNASLNVGRVTTATTCPYK